MGAFTDAWLQLTKRLPVIPGGPLRYVHNRAQASAPIENASAAPFGGADEFWFADGESAVGFFNSRSFRQDWLAPGRMLLADEPRAVAGKARLIWQREGGPAATDPVKILVLPVRRPGMAADEFRAYWTGHHAALALGGPRTRERLRRLEDLPQEEPLAGFAAAPFDGVGSIQFDTAADLVAEFSSDYYKNTLAPDEPRFTDPSASRALMVEEVLVHEQRTSHHDRSTAA